MERMHDGRRSSGGGGVGGAGLPRRRRRGSPPDAERERERRKMDRERESRSKRRRGDREEDEEESASYSSLGDDEEEDESEDEEDAVPSVSGRQFGGSGVSLPLLKKRFNSLPPAPWRVDDVIGGAVPRKARSSSANRMPSVLSGGHGNGENGDTPKVFHRPPSASASPSPSSNSAGAAAARKKMKHGRSGDKETKQQRPAAVTVRTPKLPPSPAALQEEAVPEELLEAAEVLSGLTRQFNLPAAAKLESSKARRIDSSKPDPAHFADTGATNPTSIAVPAPKRKRAKRAKCDEEESTAANSPSENEPHQSSSATEKKDVVAPPQSEVDSSSKCELRADSIREEQCCGVDLTASILDNGADRDASAADGDAARPKALDLELESTAIAASPTIAEARKADGDETATATARPLPEKKTLQVEFEKPNSNAPPEKAAVRMPIAPKGWAGGILPFGQFPPAEIKPGSSNVLQVPALLPPVPTKPKRCGTHCYIAKVIQYQQEIAKMNPCWPPAMAMAAVMAAANAASFYGPRPFAGGAVPPPSVDPYAALLGNALPGGCAPRNSTNKVPFAAHAVERAVLLGNSSADKWNAANSFAAKATQRNQTADQETPQAPAPGVNMLPAAAIYFPQAAAAANQPGAAKSTGAAGNVVPPSVSSNPVMSSWGPMNLSIAGLPFLDPQYMAILQSGGYPIAVPTHAGGAVPANGAQAIPFFNIPFYPPQVLQPGPQPSQKNSFPSGSSASNKLQLPQAQGVPGFGPNVAAANAHFFAGSNSPSGDKRPSQGQQKSNNEQKYAAPANHQNFNFAAMPNASGAAAVSSNGAGEDSKSKQQPTSGRGQKASVAPEHFSMSPGQFSIPGAAAGGAELSSLAPGNAVFQGHQEVARQGHPFFSYAAGAVLPAALHKKLPVASGSNEHDSNFGSLSKLHHGDPQQHPFSSPGNGSAIKSVEQQQQVQLKPTQQKQLVMSPPKSAAPSSTAGVQSDRLPSAAAAMMAPFPASLMSLPQNNGIPGQPSHWMLTPKGVVAAPSVPHSDAKNLSLFQQQVKPGQLPLPNSSQQSKVPFGVRSSKPSIAADVSRSASNSISSTGGNQPGAAGIAPVQQQHPAKSSAAGSSSKPPVSHYTPPSIQPHISPQKHPLPLKPQQQQHGRTKQQLPSHQSTGMLSLGSMPMPTAAAAGKVLQPYPVMLQAPPLGGAAVRQPPPTGTTNQRYVPLPPLSVKPVADQKPSQGS